MTVHQDIKRSYEKLFLIKGPEALKEAMQFLLNEKKAKNLSEIAKTTKVSPSTLSAYLNGTKVISKTFIASFNEAYNLELCNPTTYTSTLDFEEDLMKQFPMIPAEVFFKVYNRFSRTIRAQQLMIEGMRTSNKALREMNIELYDVLLKNEKAIITSMITAK